MNNVKKAIISIDSFKGCISSTQACESAAKGLKKVFPEAEIINVPISDGGEGLTEVLVHALHGKTVLTTVHGALLNHIICRYGILPADSTRNMTAVIEVASCCGLGMLKEKQKNPCLTSSYGFGELIKNALDKGCRNFLLGIGGSATNDAGLGMLQALGAKIIFADGSKEKVTGGRLCDISAIDPATLDPAIFESTFTVCCDVSNHLYGSDGAAFVFAPQKGADEKMVEKLDLGLHNVFVLSGAEESLPGDGAAGGIGFALRYFMHAQLKSGINNVLELLNFEQTLNGADLVITGEGQCDSQTMMGKVPCGILRAAQKLNIPTYLFAGNVQDRGYLLSAGFAGVYDINEDNDFTLEKRKKSSVAAKCLEQEVEKVFSFFS